MFGMLRTSMCYVLNSDSGPSVSGTDCTSGGIKNNFGY